MKKLIILVIIAAMPLSAWAKCVEYEYAEIKNMSKEELSAAIKKNHDDALEALKQTEKKHKKYDPQLTDIYNQCKVQEEKLNRIFKENFPDPEQKNIGTSVPVTN